ncbi:MAG TPA: hypothetical protein VF137_09560 [Candidatus Dormibacteraeota bacterium]
MRRRLFLGPAISFAALVTAGVLLTTPAAAQGGPTLKQYAWWNLVVYDPTLGNPPNPLPDAADLHVSYGGNPDAIEKQDTSNLVVNGATEVSAIEYDLADQLPDGVPSDVQIGTLNLPVDTAYTPAVSPQASVLACAALNPWTPAQGGNWQARVTYDMGGACAPGNFNSTSNVFTFNITAGMVRSQNAVDLAIVPGFVPLGCNVTDPTNLTNCAPNPSAAPQAPWAVDLKPPVASDITVTPVSGAGGGFSIPQQNASTVPSLGAGSLPALGPGGSTSFAPPAGGSAKPGGYSVPTSVAANPAARLNALGRGRLLAAGLLLLLFLGGLLVMGSDVQRMLTPAGQVAGIGRFARARTGPAIPV